MTHRMAGRGALALALLATACLELSSPTDEIESISAVRLPYPAAVTGDTLRDSLGVARPLEVLAFTGRGDTVYAPEELRFFLPDTGTGARIENGYFIAGARLGPVRVVGQVPGIQTPVRTIEVVAAPAVVRAHPAGLGNPATVATLTYRPADASVTSAALQVLVQGDSGGTPVNVNGWIVSYRISRQPAPTPSAPDAIPAYLADDQRRALPADSIAAADTTAGGIAGRTVVLRPVLLANPADTIEVEATVRYLGAHVPGSPIVFRIPVAPAP